MTSKKLKPDQNFITEELSNKLNNLLENPSVDKLIDFKKESIAYSKDTIETVNKLSKAKSLDKYKRSQAKQYLDMNSNKEMEEYGHKFFSDNEFKTLEINKILDNYTHLSKEELINELAEKTIIIKIYASTIQQNLKTITRLFVENKITSTKALENNDKRQKERMSKYDKNDKALIECFEYFKTIKQGILKSEDFNEFVDIVSKKYPNRLFKQETRKSSDIKKLDLIKQQEEIDNIKTIGWPEATLRNFFETQTGLKAKSIRKSSSLK